MIRPPAVAGRFYPEDPVLLREELDSLLDADAPKKIRALACLVPHAGYKYSGRVAAEVYQRVEIPSRVILIGPRHFPRGAPMAILLGGAWQTPLGLAPIDARLAGNLSRACPLLREDAIAHGSEHSLEVQLPFLQRLAPSFAFVPIVIGAVQYDDLLSSGKPSPKSFWAEDGPILLIASSDMNHYESDEVTRAKDRKAIDRILALAPRELFDTVRNENISMCGYGATVATLTTARALGASQAELVRYATSGEVNGDLQDVVGYAGVVLT